MLSWFQGDIEGISVRIAVHLGVAIGTKYHLSTDCKKRLLYQTG